MEYRQLYENAIIVAPRNQWDYFFAYRKQYPKANFSLYSEEDLEDLFAYRHDDRAVVYLLQHGYSYEKCCDSLQALRNLTLPDDPDPKLHELCQLRDVLLKQGLLFKDVAPERTFAGKSLVIHGYSDGKRISLAIKDLPHMTISYDLESQEGFPLPELHRFDDIYGELHYVCNRIARMIDSGVDIDSLYLVGVNSAYDYVLPFMAKAYGFTVEMPSTRCLMDLPLARDFVKAVSDIGVSAALAATEQKAIDDPNFATLKLTALTYQILGLGNAEQAALYRDIFLSLQEKKLPLTHAVHVLNDYHAPLNSHIFFVGFALDNAPHRHNDDDFLSDEEKTHLSLPTSRDEALEEKHDLLAFLRSGHIECLSFKAQSLGNTYFDSPLLLEEKFSVAASNELPYEYSQEFSRLWCSHLLDGYEKYLKDDKRIAFLVDALGLTYKDYDYTYHPFASFPEDTPLRFSYSGIELFYLCQFHYYLSYILGINDEEPIFNAKFGTAFHQVLQHLYDPSFNFEAEWMQALSDVQDKEGPFTPRENVLLIRLHDELSSTIDFLKYHEAKMQNPQFLTEQGFAYPFSKDSTLVGRIDKIVKTGSNQEYLTLIDYKTGSEDFHEALYEFGLSLQLPLYAFIAANDTRFNASQLLGLFIDHILAKKLVKKSGTDYEKFHNDQLMLNGIYLADPDKLATFEPDYVDSSFIHSLTFGKNGFNKKNKALKTADQLKELGEFALSKVQEADLKVRSYDFVINPKKYNKLVDSCAYCPFRDVCYVRDEARVLLKKKDLASTNGGEEPASEEDDNG